jgi:hypothetical protein
MGDEPSRAARYLVFERIINAAAVRGSPKCSKITHRIDDAINDRGQLASLARLAMPGVAMIEAGSHAFLKARCGLCPFKCDDPVV